MLLGEMESLTQVIFQETWLACEDNPWVKKSEGSLGSETGKEKVITGSGEGSSS